MQSPNILITNYCNQNCAFCFASSLMQDDKLPKEMNLKDFQILMSKLKKSKNIINTIKLLGGEPTLHSKFKKIVDLSLENFEYVHIFTNGLFSDDIYSLLKNRLPRVKFTFNIMTPIYLSNKKSRDIINKRISELSNSTEAALSMTVNPHIIVKPILNIISTELIKKTKNVRLGASNPILHKRNFYNQTDFLKMGKVIYDLALNFRQINPQINLYLDCGFVPCMFTNNQFDYFVNSFADKTYWGCNLGHIDIQSDLNAVICYPLSSEKGINLRKKILISLKTALFSNSMFI